MEEIIEIYNGEIVLKCKASGYRYTNLATGKPIKNSITGITGIIDKSGALMGWAIKCMAEWLLANLTMDKVANDLQRCQTILEAKSKYREAQKEAMDIGTAIHDYIHQWIAGKNPVLPDNPKIQNGIIAFQKWWGDNKIEPLAIERLVYSRKHNIAGRFDLLSLQDGKLYIDDWKSSKGFYGGEYAYQVAGYQILLEEEMEFLGKQKTIKNPQDKKIYDIWKKNGIAGRRIIRLGKEDGEFELKEFQNNNDLKAFLAAFFLKSREDVIKDEIK